MLVCIFYHEYMLVFLIMFLAFLADFSDGLVARAFNLHSELGKELDSLADMISFGVVPGAMMYVLISNSMTSDLYLSNDLNFAALPGFLFTVFAAIRLAKFNVDKRKTEGFFGLATPAATAFVVGLYLIYYYNPMGLRDTVGTPWLLYLLCAIVCYLMVSDVKMFSFKYKHLRWRGNEWRLIYVILGVIMLLTLKIVAIPLLVVLYVVMSILSNMFGKTVPIEIGNTENASYIPKS